MDCMKGKKTNKSKKNVNRSSNILKIIHTDICCPDMDMPGQKYFITFIDDYSQYIYIYIYIYISLCVCVCTCFITSMKHWMPSKSLKLKLITNAGSKYK